MIKQCQRCDCSVENNERYTYSQRAYKCLCVTCYSDLVEEEKNLEESN